MPTTYTHDLFGKEVYRKLPENIRRLIRENGNLYRIGLHGPDILFYYRCLSKNKVNQFGVFMHQEKARGFFEQGIQTVREEDDPAILSYLLGFVNHYILDSVTHPVVDRIVEEEGPSHTILEKELDRLLMKESGKNPFTYFPSDCIVPRLRYAHKIHKVIPLIPTDKILSALHMQKWVTNLMVRNDGGRKERIFGGILRAAGQGESLGDFFMKENPPAGIQVYLEELKECYEKALEEAPDIICEVYALAMAPEKEIHLSDRFDRTYNG